ncbi:KTSC domain-containing protein [Paenalkalicoccus suaedae]|uniref:KTSC domain-containing protein n=1 Tax=Paenalkalicoccus suaedae TaxID=2592382 RepID=A0A859FG69_9BACI|nr:KTSC domain-containing protein [Paenalkalicoccus suaedae]QKS71820.1 KTSC domain-containing protein [Paenalkalicoccus suaedae]
MEWSSLEDGAIEAGYDEMLHQLHIKKTGDYYIYYEVEKNDFIALLESSSPSSYLKDTIASKYEANLA